MAPIRRMTLFTTNTEADIEVLTEQFKTVQQNAKKNGSNYILSLSAGKTVSDPRSKGVTFAVIATFANLDDMKYYDNEDPVHAELKKSLTGKMQGPPLAVYYEESIAEGKF